MGLDYGIADTADEQTIAKLAGKIDACLKGHPAHLCMMALADVVARAMVEATADHIKCVDAFGAFMSITAKELLFREAKKRAEPPAQPDQGEQSASTPAPAPDDGGK